MVFEKSDEEKLIKGLIKGQEQALRSLYKNYTPRLRRFIQVKVGLEEDVEEILHDSLLSALDSLVLFSRRSSLLTWLCSIARHEIADFYRRKRIKTIVFSRTPRVQGFVSRALEPDAKLMRTEYERKIGVVLDRLLPQQREVLELKYMDGFSVAEIAERMGMSFKACESLLTRSRRAFVIVYEES